MRKPEPSLPTVSKPVRLGVHLVGDGVDVAVHAGHATAVDVCFIDVSRTGQSERRFALHRDMHGIWTGHVPDIQAGQAYGFRVSGRWDPHEGQRHNPAKLLLDPYTRGLARGPQLHPSLYSHVVDSQLNPDPTMPADDRDSAPFAPLGVVVADAHNPTKRPHIPWEKTVLYEAHVISMTKRMERIPEELRGTYAGLAHPETIAHLKNLGVTAIELLPVHAKMSEPFLTQKGMENYWGYNTLAFFAPEPTYAMKSNQEAGPQAVIDEFKGMVDLLHQAGIEVILDVVYNHTCEAGADGPTVSWRGLDNTMYYRHDSARPGVMKDTTGCGNSLDFRRQTVMQMTLDSLRYWVTEMGVDGFRFDLSVTMSREGDSFNHNHPLFVAMGTDPVLSTVKLINEPWDLGPGGWRTGQFPLPTADWNDRFRDSLRSFWLTAPASIMHGGHGSDPRDLATRLAGSADLFGHGRIPGGRGIHSSINFITAHDGFTMHDLASYNAKHNEANDEDNRDGTTNNRSWNHGVEGKPEDEELPASVRAARLKSVRNLMASLILAGGTPMINSGDEILKTQHGNNNAYCQNSPLSWLDWNIGDDEQNMFDTTAYLLRLRRDHSVLRPTRFYTGNAADGDPVRDLEWLDPHGHRMADYKWFDNQRRLLQVIRSGNGTDADALLILNGAIEDCPVTLPQGRGTPFHLVWSSSWDRPREETESYAPGAVTSIEALSINLYLANPE